MFWVDVASNLRFSPAESATSSACATRVAISACTLKTSVSGASNGCAHRDAPLEARLSSGLTCTRLVPSLSLAKRTAPVRR